MLGFCASAQVSTAATTWHVTKCGDVLQKGGYTLRIAVNGKAADGDTVDFVGLPDTCSTITLTQGEIATAANYLTIQGPTDRVVTIDGSQIGRIFNHSGNGQLAISNLKLTGGKAAGVGGCIRSSGNVRLQSATVTGCDSGAQGGGVYSYGNTLLVDSSLTDNQATAAYWGSGGAVYAKANVFASGVNTITGNHAFYTAGIRAREAITFATSILAGNLGGTTCGAAYAGGYLGFVSSIVSANSGGLCATDAHLTSTTVTDNRTQFLGNYFLGSGLLAYSATIVDSTFSNQVYGIKVYGGGPGGPTGSLTMRNSTVSGNGRGIEADSASLDIGNSTIAFNVEGISAQTCDLTINSSIVARNSGGSDIYATLCNSAGAHNLIQHSTEPFTLSITADPQLTPLGDHGGPVATHALSAGSPAIDAGSNGFGLATDQRGSGFPRVAGAASDIGAYERQPVDDELFYDGFD